MNVTTRNSSRASNLRFEIISLSSRQSDTEDDYWYRVMEICFQKFPIHFGIEYPSYLYKDFEYLDCGTYSHVIKAIALEINNTPIVFKIIKVIQRNTLNRLNELSFKGFELYSDVFQEIIITKKLSDLHQITCDYRGYEYQTHSFPRIYGARIVHGEIPNYFLIRKYDETIAKAKPVERFDDLFGVPNEHLVIVMKFCGDSLWHLMQHRYRVTPSGVVGISPDQLLSVSYQVTLCLAVSEGIYQFEHRDLHICNVLVKETKKEYVTFVIRSIIYRVKSFGVKACVIDATFSRLLIGTEVYFTDLSNRLKATAVNPNPDAQEVAYQMMYKKIGEKWQDWFPVSNIYWLKYFYNEVLTSEAFMYDCDQLTKNNLIRLSNQIYNYESLADFIYDMFHYGTDSSHTRRTTSNTSSGTSKSGSTQSIHPDLNFNATTCAAAAAAAAAASSGTESDNAINNENLGRNNSTQSMQQQQQQQNQHQPPQQAQQQQSQSTQPPNEPSE